MRAIAATGVGAKLNLGCGTDVRPGYLNVDFRQTHPNVIVRDLSEFPWPFEDGSADEILMLDFLEHFPYAQTPRILLECWRVLAPTGRVTIQVPDAVQTCRAMVMEGQYQCNRCGARVPDVGRYHWRCKCGQDAKDIAEAAMKRLYGGQDYAGNFHQTAFTEDSLLRKCRMAGLVPADAKTEAERKHFWDNWTINVTFVKGDVW